MNHNDVYPAPLVNCFNFFFRINSLSTSHLRYMKKQFYKKVYNNNQTPIQSTVSLDDSSKLCLKNTKHRYEKVSTPVSCGRIPRFQQKGLIVVWPQRKKLPSNETFTFMTWLLAHTLYLLYIMNLLPSASVVALKEPPWYFKGKFRKTLRKDYIIEPDWDSV